MRSRQIGKKGHSASCGRGVLPIKTCSAKWKVGFVSAQKPFLVITNGNFMRKNIVPLTVRYPFRVTMSRSSKWKSHHVAVKWLFGKMTSGVFAVVNDRMQESKKEIWFLRIVSPLRKPKKKGMPPRHHDTKIHTVLYFNLVILVKPRAYEPLWQKLFGADSIVGF